MLSGYYPIISAFFLFQKNSVFIAFNVSSHQHGARWRDLTRLLSAAEVSLGRLLLSPFSLRALRNILSILSFAILLCRFRGDWGAAGAWPLPSSAPSS